MRAIPLRTVTGLQVISNGTGNPPTIGEVPSMIERLSCSAMVRGDFKRPNAHWFNLHRQYGNAYETYSSGVYNGRPGWDRDQSDFRIVSAADTSGAQPHDVDWARTDDRCMEKIYEQIRGSANLAIDLAEGGSTLRMLSNLRNMRKEIIKSVISTKKSKNYRGLTNGQRRLDYATEKWLEARYGWMPFMYSTYDIIDTLGKRFDNILVPVSGRSGVTIDEKSTSGSGSYGDPYVENERQLQFRTEISILFNMPGSRSLYDWTSISPLTIAWETMTLSFVADWFLNIGNLLSLWENYFVYANRFSRGYITRSYKETLDFKLWGESTEPFRYAPNGDIYDGTYYRSRRSGHKVVRKMLDRQVLTHLPLPAQGIRVNPNLNAKRLLDATALFHVFTKRKVREIESGARR